MAAIIKEDAAPLEANIPAPLRWIIERCLAKDPAERYDSTRDLYRDLRQVKDRLSDITFVATDAAPVAPSAPQRSSKLPWIAAAALALVIAALLFWPLPTSEPPSLTPFATDANIQVTPRWSPKGDRIAYAADVNGVLQVFTRALGSSTPTQITHEPESAYSPMWSGDASRIYYLTGFRPNTALRSIAVAGGQANTLLKDVYIADLTRDGKTLAVFLRDAPGTYRLAFASPPEALPKPYTLAPIADFRTPGVGQQMAFDQPGTNLALAGLSGSQVWKIPVNGSQPHEEAGMRGSPVSQFTIQDASHVILGSDNLGSPRLRVYDLQSGAPQTLSVSPARQLFPALSPDSATLAFSEGEFGFDVVEYPLDGSAGVGLITTPRQEVSPAWAPDGLHFAYSTDRSGESEVWLRNRLDGSERRIATPSDSLILDLAISPDGSRAAYRALRTGGEHSIWIAPMNGEAPVRMWDSPDPQRGPSWSPNGSAVAFYGIHDGKASVMTIGIGGTEPKVLAPLARLNPVRWSPRGNWILYRDGDVLKAVSPDGKQNRTVSEHTWETFGWSRDGGRVVGIARGDNRRLLLLQVEIDSGRESRIADLGPVPPEFDLGDLLNEFPYRGFSLHPDGKSFLTSVLRIKTGIYLMKDFDRPQRLIDLLR